MTRRDASTPTPIGALLTAAVPPLADKLLATAVRREWPKVVGPEISRRAEPGDLRAGTLTVVVDNSPWLQELTLREGELLSRLQARFGVDSIAALQFLLGTVSRPSEVPHQKTRRADESLTPEEEAWVERTISPIGDPALAETVRRLLVKGALSWRRAGALLLLLFFGLTGCAAVAPAPADAPPAPIARPAKADPAAEAYYYYAVAQLHAQAGQLTEAIADLREAIKRDPTTPPLWTQLAIWLSKTDAAQEAVEAGLKAASLAPDDSSVHLTLAEIYRSQKRWPDAEAELEKVIALNRESPDGYLTLARYFVEQRAHDRAREVLLRLIKISPNLAQAHFLLGRLAIETEAWDEAVRELERAVELDPDQDAAWTALGYVHETRHQPEDAIAVYRRAIQANPDNPGFVERLGDLLIRLGKLQEAQQEIEALASQMPHDAPVWMKLGAIYYEQKAYDKATDAFRQVLVLEPGNLRARYFLATTYMDAGKDAEARAELERILRADPRSIDARVQLGFLHGRAKRYADAIALFKEAVNLEPRRPELFLYLGTGYFRAEQYDDAIRTLQEGLGIDPSNKDIEFQLGVVYEKQKRFDDAVRSFRRVIALDPKHAEAYNYVGYMFAERGTNLDEAVVLIKKALELEPDNGYFIDSLGWAFYQQGRYGEALRELRRAVERAKEDPVIFDHLGDAYLKGGFEDDALAAWEKSLQLDPTNEAVKKKVQETRDKRRNVKGERSKAQP